MGDGQEIPNEFLKKARCNTILTVMREQFEKDKPIEEQHITIISTLCWGCGAMIEDVIEGDENWLFCPCGTGIMKVTI